MKLVLATNNQDKIKEMKNLLDDLGVEILTSKDFENFPDIEETGSTLSENAILKAEGIYKFTGLPSLADDSGLEVDALKGAPGVYSSRFAGEDCSYEDNNKKLLLVLEGITKENRTARFRCVIAICFGQGQTQLVAGSVEGFITEEKADFTHGFGYDPVFYFPPLKKTFAEVTLDEKNAVSHRGQALVKAKAVLKEYLST
ncbi:MAG: XTP/dITP diphosphatase [candidate division Zixibacteria bacterium]|nr:XTP/dITP diphosphatase [candidate division Zixibacteria bacterium]